MPDLYESLIGAPPSGQQETSALAKKLRRNQDLGMIFGMTGHKDIGRMGETLMDQTQNQTEGLQKSRQAQIKQDFEVEKQAALEQHWADELANRLKIAQMRENDRRATNQQRLDDKKEILDTKRLTVMSKNLEQFRPLNSNLSVIDDLLRDYTTRDKDGKVIAREDIPGVGRGQTVPLISAALRTDVGSHINNAIEELQAEYGRIKSGLTVSEQERRRLDSSMGRLSVSNEQNFLDRYMDVRDALDAAIQGGHNSYEDLSDKYNAQNAAIKPRGRFKTFDEGTTDFVEEVVQQSGYDKDKVGSFEIIQD